MKRAQRDRVGATRGKLALVGVLAAALVCVLAVNFGGQGDGDDASQAAEAAAPATGELAVDELAASATEPGANPFGKFAQDDDWPKPALDKLVGFDPMAAPAWIAPVERAAIAETGEAGATSLEELRNAASAIIFIADGQRVARIGTQDYHVGDFVGPYRITEISSAGIVLSESTLDR